VEPPRFRLRELLRTPTVKSEPNTSMRLCVGLNLSDVKRTLQMGRRLQPVRNLLSRRKAVGDATRTQSDGPPLRRTITA
jgi:hypothetical protein